MIEFDFFVIEKLCVLAVKFVIIKLQYFYSGKKNIITELTWKTVIRTKFLSWSPQILNQANIYSYRMCHILFDSIVVQISNYKFSVLFFGLIISKN